MNIGHEAGKDRTMAMGRKAPRGKRGGCPRDASVKVAGYTVTKMIQKKKNGNVFSERSETKRNEAKRKQLLEGF